MGRHVGKGRKSTQSPLTAGQWEARKNLLLGLLGEYIGDRIGYEVSNVGEPIVIIGKVRLVVCPDAIGNRELNLDCLAHNILMDYRLVQFNLEHNASL